MNRRTVLACAGISLIAPLAGCSKNGDSTPVSSHPAYDRTVRLSNRDTKQHNVDITIAHEGPQDVIYEERHSIAPDEDVGVYDFRDAPTEGVETYTITGQLEKGRRDSVSYRTNRCHGNPIVYVNNEGKIHASYSMC